MIAAEHQKKDMDPPAASDVTDDLRQPVLRVWIEPEVDSSQIRDSIDLAISIEHVVIRPERRKDEAVQPLSFETEPVEFSNLLGAQYVSTRALATFPADDALAAAERSDLEVVVITPGGERPCNVDDDDVFRMFHLERP